VKPEEFMAKYNRLPTENDWVYIREIERKKLMSKFHVGTRPLMHPGRCMGCLSNSEDGRKYVDLGCDIQEYINEVGVDLGRLYICSFCIKELSNLLFPPQAGVAAPPTIKDDDRPKLDQILAGLNIITEFLSSKENVSGNNSPSDFDNSSSSIADPPIVNSNTGSENSGKDDRNTSESELPVTEQDTSSHVPSLEELLGRREVTS
jgi:hypothetical protein